MGLEKNHTQKNRNTMKKYFDDCKTEPQVKREYRKLAHKYHPDKSGGDKEIFQEIERQRREALRRIAVSEGKAASYYEELAAKMGKEDFGSSLLKVATEIDKKLTADGIGDNADFKTIFNAVAAMFHEPKRVIEKKEDPKPLPGDI